MIDATCDDNFVEWRLLLPAIVSIGILRRNCPVFNIVASNQIVIDAAGVFCSRLDALYCPNFIVKLRLIRRFTAPHCSEHDHLFPRVSDTLIGSETPRVRYG